MDWQDIAVGLITALCAVLFLRHFLRPRRKKRPGGGCPEKKGTATSGKNCCTTDKGCGRSPEYPLCEGCPLRCEISRRTPEKRERKKQK